MVADRGRIDPLRRNNFRRGQPVPRLPADGRQAVRAAQLPVIDRQCLLDETGLLQQGPKLAGSLNITDGRGIVAEFHLFRGLMIGGKMRQHARADIDAFADI